CGIKTAREVKVGDTVKRGDGVGSCGNSGRSPTPHLHFQFQATDKLGDKTTVSPIGHYLENREGKFILHAFDIPVEGMAVQNIETHKIIRQAFEFKLGDKLSFEYMAGNKSRTEEWEVKVDIYNNIFIESSAGATVYVATVGKVMYLTNFLGNKHSALYYFYLTSIQVPLCYEPNLQWTDRYQLSKLISNLVRYASELFLVFSPQINATGTFAFEERDPDAKDYVLTSRIAVRGSGVFSFYKKTWNGTLVVDQQGFIKEIQVVTPDGSQIRVIAKTNEEKQG
ncbi:MAG: M23 family metallopeptidase, partial [Bacteroidota bacterium]